MTIDSGIWNVNTWPGLAVSGTFSATFNPVIGETQMTCCPGRCVFGMSHSIVTSFTAGSSGSTGAGAGTGSGSRGFCGAPIPVTIDSGIWNVNIWPGLAVSGTFSATFNPVIGEIQTTFCPGRCVCGMSHLIVTSCASAI